MPGYSLTPERFGPRLNLVPGLPETVRAYSVTGDGQTDDYNALREVAAKFGTTGHIYFPAGTYRVGTNLTFNCLCEFAPGATFDPDSGVTVTLAGPVRVAPGASIVAAGTTGTVSITGAMDAGGGEFNVKAFGAVGDGVTDDTAAIQVAITAAGTRGEIVFPDGIYRCANLTSTATQQRFRGIGKAILMKNANGPILTCSGAGVQMYNMDFRGESATPAFTGDNLVISGDDALLIGCGSRNAFGRALKATGNQLKVLSSNEIWQTADATGSGFDIEVGVSGTVTAYHQLFGIVSTQSTGGIRFVDTGSQAVVGGQFGKLSIEVGTGPAGVNGGYYSSLRILGAVTVNVSNAIFQGCHFGTSAPITIGANTTGVVIDQSNLIGSTIVNNGNKNNVLVKQTSGGSTQKWRFGDDSSAAYLEFDPTAPGYVSAGSFRLPNNVNYNVNQSSGALGGRFGMGATDNLSLANDVANKAVLIGQAGASGTVNLVVNSATRVLASVSGLHVGANTSAPFLSSGTGTPEGAVTAPVGSLFLRTDGGAGTSLYVKETGTGNTGWVNK